MTSVCVCLESRNAEIERIYQCQYNQVVVIGQEMSQEESHVVVAQRSSCQDSQGYSRVESTECITCFIKEEGKRSNGEEVNDYFS